MVNIIKILIGEKLIEEIQKESWEIIGGYEWKRQICRVGRRRSDYYILFSSNPRQTVHEVFPHTAFLNEYTYEGIASSKRPELICLIAFAIHISSSL